MKLKTFAKGGLHIQKYKLSASDKTEVLPLPEYVYVPVKQHIGAPAKIVVSKGDKVLVGNLLAEADGVISANVHAPVSGEIVKIEEIDNPQGFLEQVVVIKREGDEFAPELDMSDDIVRDITKTPTEIHEIIKRSGIVGMGGAGFPTPVKVQPPKGKKVDTLIINGIECEPYLTADGRLMIEKAEQIIIGAKILNKLLGIQNAVIAIDENKPEAIKKLSQITKTYVGVNVQACKSVYPQGGEKQLINAITGREVPSGKLPFDAGCVVQNVATVYAIYEAVQKNIPLFQRIVTVSGDAVKNPANYWVRIGTPLSWVIEQNGADMDNVGKVLLGGPMMGQAISDLSAPLTKTVSGILLMSEGRSCRPEAEDCIRCSRCVEYCPTGLMPFAIRQDLINNDTSNLKQLHVNDCIECGLCAYVCPAKIPLLDFCKLGKYELRKKQKD